MLRTVRGIPRRAGRAGFVRLREALSRKPGVYAPHGIPIRADARADFALRFLLARGEPYEAPEADLIDKYLAPDTDVIELGGCIGVVSATIRNKIGPHAHHVVVEANPDIASLALENATGAMPERTELVQAAVDYSGAERVRFSRGVNHHTGHVAKEGEDGFFADTTTLSALADRLPGRFALVCDIEGGELALFHAEIGGDALARCDLIVLEIHPHTFPNKDADTDALTNRLANIGLQKAEQISNVIAYRRQASA